MAAEKALFFIALVPPADRLEELTHLKLELSNKYGAVAALRSPPHITLHMPFKFRQDKTAGLESALVHMCSEMDSFQVSIKKYDAFPPRVIYLHVEESKALAELHSSCYKLMKERFNIFNAQYKERSFHPHLTVLFRDLKKERFQQAWEDLKSAKINYEWKVEDICLLRHSGKQWEVFKRFYLKTS